MEKELLADLLEEKNQTLLNFLNHQDIDKWQERSANKWSSGQHTLHLLECLKHLNNLLSMPKFLLRMKYGKANREVRSYDQIVLGYIQYVKDSNSNTVINLQNIKSPSLKDKEYLLDRLQVEGKKLQYKTKKISDLNLDTVVLPHPILGKMPVRELIMWTGHHIEHHTRILQEN